MDVAAQIFAVPLQILLGVVISVSVLSGSFTRGGMKHLRQQRNFRAKKRRHT